ncbi:alpha/beta-hydrolase [Colletotrichum eremochloae]|nr:alpha/beta-hydrolase [Colletotrichum eremochloae]
MRYLFPFIFASCFAAGRALPLENVDVKHGAGAPSIYSLQAREPHSILVENDLQDGSCNDYLFFYLRGSRQKSNMGGQPRPQLAAYLRQTLTTRIAIQGIDYPAKRRDNLCVDNHLCRPSEVTKATGQIEKYMDQCPDAKVLIAGYSQGAAMVSRIISARLEPEYKDRILAAVTFGNTM